MKNNINGLKQNLLKIKAALSLLSLNEKLLISGE